MCGIAGTLAFKSSPDLVDSQKLATMAAAIEHRGPDAGGVWISIDGRIGLAHRRLSIVDLSEQANQPMQVEGGRYQIVYNGEIYNHAEIRAELEKCGHQFRTINSDTETVLRAYVQWGVASVDRFRGMFAFAIWDNEDKVLWIVRDRIGVKPLYYTVSERGFAFASEIKALLSDPKQRRAVNERALFDYLTFMTVPAPNTLFEGVFKLPAGTSLLINGDGVIKERRYWDVWSHVAPLPGITFADASDRVLACLKESVNYRKMSDVGMGVFLSGGVDSSANVALFQNGESSPVKTFSIGYDNDYGTYQNELHHADFVANTFKTEHYEKRLTQNDLIDFLPKMVELQDEPIADPVCFPLFYVAEMAQKEAGIKVAQVGEGADELFCGYPSWQRSLLLQKKMQIPGAKSLSKIGLTALDFINRNKGFRYEYLRRGSLGQPIFWTGADCFSDMAKRRLLSSRLRAKFADYTSYEVLRPIRQRFESNAWEPSNLNWMSYVDLSIRLPELLLMRVDKMSMGSSLECRVPFLDHEFVTLALSLPSEIKTRDAQLKSVLKNALRGVVPDKIIDRPKQGFGAPVFEWFFDKLGQYAREEIMTFARETDFLDPIAVQTVFDDGDGFSAWWLLNLALWHKHYIAPSNAR